MLPPRDREHAARIDAYRRQSLGLGRPRDGEFDPLPSDSEHHLLTSRIPDDHTRWQRIHRVCRYRGITLHRTLIDGTFNAYLPGGRKEFGLDLDALERLLLKSCWSDRL